MMTSIFGESRWHKPSSVIRPVNARQMDRDTSDHFARLYGKGDCLEMRHRHHDHDKTSQDAQARDRSYRSCCRRASAGHAGWRRTGPQVWQCLLKN